jgi:hypothetical protein
MAKEELDLAKLARELERMQAYRDIQNIMGRYQYVHCCGRFPETADLFAKRDDSTAQIGTWGLYRGWDNIQKLYAGLHVWLEHENREGFMFEHDMTTPVIEVAGDCKTAKGVWMAPGHETINVPGALPASRKIVPGWCYVKYGCDFIKHEGEWKIWHLFVFLTLYCHLGESWDQGGEHDSAGVIPTAPKELQGEPAVAQFHDPYDPRKVRKMLPAAPKPYQTYDEKEGIWWMDGERIPRKKPYMYKNPGDWKGL